MPNSYTQQDIQLTDDGDLVVASNGDLKTASIDQTTKQDAILNLYTIYGDFSAFPSVGSRIMDYIGEPNTRYNGGLLKNEVIRALTNNNRWQAQDVSTRVVPIDIDSIALYVTILNAATVTPQTLVFDFNYISGLTLVSSS